MITLQNYKELIVETNCNIDRTSESLEIIICVFNIDRTSESLEIIICVFSGNYFSS